MRTPTVAIKIPVARGAVPSTAPTPTIMVRTPVTNLIIFNFLEVKGAGPVDGVTTVNDVSPCSVPSRSSITSGFQNVTLFELLVLVGVDNETPNATTFGEYLDVFGTRLVGNFVVELSDHPRLIFAISSACFLPRTGTALDLCICAI